MQWLIDFDAQTMMFAPSFLISRDLVLQTLARHGDLLCDLPPQYKNDPEIVLAAIASHPDAYSRLSTNEKLNVSYAQQFLIHATSDEWSNHTLPESLFSQADSWGLAFFQAYARSNHGTKILCLFGADIQNDRALMTRVWAHIPMLANGQKQGAVHGEDCRGTCLLDAIERGVPRYTRDPAFLTEALQIATPACAELLHLELATTRMSVKQSSKRWLASLF